MAHLKKSILINAPFEQVHALARDPKHWDSWYVGFSEPEKITGEGGVGTVVLHNVLLAGIRFPITSTMMRHLFLSRYQDKKRYPGQQV